MRPWRTLARRVVYTQPPWLEVSVERIELPDGKVVEDYLQLRARDFAIIVAFTEDGRIPLVRSYKHGTRQVALSLPAGYIEQGEDPLAAAKRELLEEAGMEAREWAPLGRFVIDGNYGHSIEHAFVARGARKVREPDPGDLEEMEIVMATRAEATRALRANEVVQVSSAAPLALALLR